MARMTRERRRRFIVNAPMQRRIVLSTAVLPALALGAVAVVTAIWCNGTMNRALEIDPLLPNLTPLIYVSSAFQVVAGVLLVLSTLKVSHRVAGPAYRICKSLERIRSGDISFRVQLRKKDHLTEIADEMNRLLDWLNENPPKGCLLRAAVEGKGALDGADSPAEAPAASASAEASEPAART
ncbi:MAG: hypothetical protein Fur0037_03570 [Planctomycetota bacterium]